ncbi:uncharacterized protein LOC144106705 [Amblyomma americanum]
MSNTDGRLLYLTRGFAAGVNWRPTRFAENVPTWSVCALCRVVAKRSVLLPCSHVLCEPCRRGSVQDGEPVCPLDGEAFREEECQQAKLPARKADGMKAHCWNEAHGCDFVGTLPAVLRHYEDECSFHAVPCPRCGQKVLSTCLPTHCLGGCLDAPPSSAAQREPQRDGARGFSEELSEIKAILRDQEQLPALQTQVNELTERTRGHEARLQEITAALSGNLETLNAELTRVLGKFSAAFDEVLCTEQRVRASSVPEASGEGERGASGEAGPSETVAWRREKKHILRKLDLMISGALGCLEDIRQCAVVRMAHPTESMRIPSARMEQMIERRADPYPLDKTENKGLHYLLTVMNADSLTEHWAFEGSGSSPFTVVTAWHGLHTYFAVRVGVSKERADRLEVTFTWNRTCETHCSLPKVVRVKMGSPKSAESHLLKENQAGLTPVACEHRQMFYVDPEWTSWWNYVGDGNLLFEIEVDR